MNSPVQQRSAWAPLALALLLTLGLTACADRADDDAGAIDTTATADTTMAAQEITVQIEPTTDASNVRGVVTISTMDSTVQMSGNISGLAPGEHGFHIHQNPDCGDGGQAAGGHWNPQNTPHGAPDDAPSNRHAGDFGNITAGDDSTAAVDVSYARSELSLPSDLMSHTLMIHAGEDDLSSQPSGAAGDRVGCGVIEQGGGMASDTTSAM